MRRGAWRFGPVNGLRRLLDPKDYFWIDKGEMATVSSLMYCLFVSSPLPLGLMRYRIVMASQECPDEIGEKKTFRMTPC